jgi:hypothetical protein
MTKAKSSLTEEQVCIYLLEQYGSFNCRSFRSLTEKQRLQILRQGRRGADGYVDLLNQYVIVGKIRFSRISPEEQRKILARGRQELARLLAKEEEASFDDGSPEG